MPDENRFFRFLWRFNAVLLAVAGVLAVLFLGGIAVSIAVSNFATRDAAVPLKNTPVDKIRLELGTESVALRGTPFVIYSLNKVRDRDSETGVGSGSSFGGRYNPSQVANYLVVDTGAARGNWVFPSETQAIWEQYPLYRTPAGDDGDAVIALVLTVADSDTNKDGALSGGDRPSLYYYRPGDSRATKFFSADEIIGVRQLDAARFWVSFGNGGHRSVAVFSTGDFQLLRKGEMPRMPD